MAGKTNRLFWAENIFLLVAVVALWPPIFLGWTGTGWLLVECAVLTILIAIFIRRVKAARRK